MKKIIYLLLFFVTQLNAQENEISISYAKDFNISNEYNETVVQYEYKDDVFYGTTYSFQSHFKYQNALQLRLNYRKVWQMNDKLQLKAGVQAQYSKVDFNRDYQREMVWDAVNTLPYNFANAQIVEESRKRYLLNIASPFLVNRFDTYQSGIYLGTSYQLLPRWYIDFGFNINQMVKVKGFNMRNPGNIDSFVPFIVLEKNIDVAKPTNLTSNISFTYRLKKMGVSLGCERTFTNYFRGMNEHPILFGAKYKPSSVFASVNYYW